MKDIAGRRWSSAFRPPTLLAAATVLAGACGGEAPEPAESEEPPPAAAAEPEADPPDAPGVREVGPNRFEVVVHAFEGGYRPSEIRVTAGAEVTFRVRSTDVPHGFTIEGTPVEVDIYPESFTEVTHTFPEPGEYPFLCHVYCGGGHDAMRGRVIVEAPGGG